MWRRALVHSTYAFFCTRATKDGKIVKPAVWWGAAEEDSWNWARCRKRHVGDKRVNKGKDSPIKKQQQIQFGEVPGKRFLFSDQKLRCQGSRICSEVRELLLLIWWGDGTVFSFFLNKPIGASPRVWFHSSSSGGFVHQWYIGWICSAFCYDGLVGMVWKGWSLMDGLRDSTGRQIPSASQKA